MTLNTGQQSPIPTTGPSTKFSKENTHGAQHAYPHNNLTYSRLGNLEALADRVELLECVMEHFPGGIALFDKNLNMVLCNEELKRILEYPESLFTDGLPHMEDIFRFNATRGEYGDGDIEQIVKDKMALADEMTAHLYERERPNGTIVEVRGVPLKDGGFLTTYMDVTKQNLHVRHLEALLDSFPGGIALFDKGLKMVMINQQQKEMQEYPASLFENGLPTLEELFVFNAKRGEYGEGDIDTLVADKMALVDLQTPHVYQRERPNGTVFEVRGVPLKNGGFLSTYVDVTEQSQRVLQLETLLDNFPGGISLFDKDLKMVLINEQLKDMHEYPEELFEDGLPSLENIFRCNAERGEYGEGDVEDQISRRMTLAAQREAHTYDRKRPNGAVLEVRGVPLKGSGFLTTYRDVTEHRKNQEMIAHLAHHDVLTDLPNRALFRDRLDHAVAQANRGYPMALHCIDLDKFKPVNDTYGHAVGDQLLKLIADRFRKLQRDTDTIARIGGDEFVIVQVGIKDREGAAILARRVIKTISVPYEIDGHTIEIGASIGIALAPADNTSPEELMKSADAALYECKEAGRGCFKFHSKT